MPKKELVVPGKIYCKCKMQYTRECLLLVRYAKQGVSSAGKNILQVQNAVAIHTWMFTVGK